MAVLSILILLALTDTATGLLWRHHFYVQENMSWTDAQMYCRSHGVDLSVFDSEWDFDVFVNQTFGMSGWIGLRKNPGETAFTTWSDGRALTFSKWKAGEPDNPGAEDCVFTGSRWKNDNCENVHYFFCYTSVPRLFVVQEMMTWKEALVYCRTHYTDIVILNSWLDYYVIYGRKSEILTPTFWTSLRFMDGSWFWVNYYFWAPSSFPPCPARPFHCGAWNIQENVWQNRDCEEKMNFICFSWW